MGVIGVVCQGEKNRLTVLWLKLVKTELSPPIHYLALTGHDICAERVKHSELESARRE